MANGSKPDRELLAQSIQAALSIMPARPTNLNAENVERSYVDARLHEVISVWRAHGIEPAELVLIADASLCMALRTPADTRGVGYYGEVDGVKVTIDLAVEDRFIAAGSFAVEVDALHPATVWVPAAYGMAYPTAVSEEEWVTRWVLQVTDGFDAVDAANAARLL